ncbi:MAG: DNA-binding protein WhiA [Clostridia bacterium]|nr:DNA-binding protein WhiA [Clostridia bacterium]
MSFTEEIKNELTRTPPMADCCAAAECLGMLLYCNRFAPDKVRMITASADVRRRARSLFWECFGAELYEEGDREDTLVIDDPEIIHAIFDWYGYQFKNAALSLNRAIVEEECCKAAFLRGCFLMGGYVTAGKSGYHLELVTPHYNVSNQVSALLYEMDMEPGAVTRRSNYVLYYKNSERIETFLSAIGATGAAMDLMLQKVEKALVNKINRKVNCENANFDKTLDAANRQLDAIRHLEESGLLAELSLDLQMTAQLRKDNPMAPLSELAAMFDPPISKPGVSNRLKRLVKISEGSK